jgi:GNAT superfamily N-acetyltransferase
MAAMENTRSGFDLLGFWLDHLRADRSAALAGSDCAIYPRRRPGEHMIDLLSAAGTCHIVLNRSLFEAFAADTAGHAPSRAACAGWLHHQTGAELEGDNLFYDLGAAAAPTLPAGASVRELTEADATAFAVFDRACSPDDLEAGFVELDHDLVAGVFLDGALVCKASAFDWSDGDEYGPVWDIGYVTRPDMRGKGFGKAAAGFLAAGIRRDGRIAQIRAADSRPASVGIAKALGFTRFGFWEYPAAEE